jgi:glycosyltransferase involved in cell wall biosynthesis
MRIALVSDAFSPQVSGVVTVLRRIVELLGRAGHDAAVVAPEYPDSQPGHGVGELRVPSVAFPPYPAVRLSLPQLRRVAHFLDGFQPDVVHVVTEGPLGFLGRHYALRRGVPLVTSYHTHFPQYCRHYGIPALEHAVWSLLTWFHGPARLIHTPGVAARDELRRRGLAQAVLWGRGVDTHRFDPDRRGAATRRRLGVRDDQVLILHVGRLAAEKNLDLLADAFSTAGEALGSLAVFAVAGDGPSAHRLYRRLPGVRKLGFLPVGELADVYASADLCVFPSHTETCGLVALEALASGVPVVVADAAGLRESVVHGRTGLLVPPHDARGFAAAVVRLALDGSSRHLMGLAARRFALTRDCADEDRELLAQYAAVAWTPETTPSNRSSRTPARWRHSRIEATA